MPKHDTNYDYVTFLFLSYVQIKFVVTLDWTLVTRIIITIPTILDYSLPLPSPLSPFQSQSSV